MHDWITFIKNDENNALSTLYKLHRESLVHTLVRQSQLSYNDALEVFQCSVCILYDNVMSGKLVSLSSSIQSYLMGICRNQAKQFKRQQSKFHFDERKLPHEDTNNEEERVMKESLFVAMQKSLLELGNPCKLLLENYYYRRWDMKRIVAEMGYKNENSAKNQKYKCLKRLQSLAFKHLSKETIIE